MGDVKVRSERVLPCPSCGRELTPVVSDGTEVDVCGACGGTWLDFLDETQFLKKMPLALTIDDLHRLRKIYEPLGKVDAVKYRKCPVCADLMYRRNWGGNSGVIVDRCQAHGSWMEAGEPEKIREYIALGGIEYEKLRHHESGVSVVRDKLHKEVSRLDAKIIADRHWIGRIWTAIAYR